MVDWNLFFSIITVIVAIIALFQTSHQISIRASPRTTLSS